MTITTDKIFCASCKLEILEKTDVAALRDEIVHQRCKNEWVQFQKPPKEKIETKTFENESIYSIMAQMGFQPEERFGMENDESSYRYGQTDDFQHIYTPGDGSYQHEITSSLFNPLPHNRLSILCNREVAGRIAVHDVVIIKTSEHSFKTHLIEKQENPHLYEINCIFEILEELQPEEHRTFFQRFEFIYPTDFTNRVAKFAFASVKAICRLASSTFVSHSASAASA